MMIISAQDIPMERVIKPSSQFISFKIDIDQLVWNFGIASFKTVLPNVLDLHDSAYEIALTQLICLGKSSKPQVLDIGLDLINLSPLDGVMFPLLYRTLLKKGNSCFQPLIRNYFLTTHKSISTLCLYLRLSDFQTESFEGEQLLITLELRKCPH